MHKFLVVPFLAMVLLLAPACSKDQWTSGLNATANVIEKDLPVAEAFLATEHDAGNLSDAAYGATLDKITRLRTKDLPLFRAGIAAVTNVKGFCSLSSALFPVINDVIVSGLAIKNPESQRRALGYAAGVALILNTITAPCGGAVSITLPSGAAETPEFLEARSQAVDSILADLPPDVVTQLHLK